jgi:hypothetical protein
VRPQKWSLIDILSRLGIGSRPTSQLDASQGPTAREPHRNSAVIALAGALPFAAAGFWRVTYTPFPFGSSDVLGPLSDGIAFGVLCFGAWYLLRRLMNPRVRRRGTPAGRARARVTLALFEAIALAGATIVAPLSWGIDPGPGDVLAVAATGLTGALVVWLAAGLMVDAPPDGEASAT